VKRKKGKTRRKPRPPVNPEQGEIREPWRLHGVGSSENLFFDFRKPSVEGQTSPKRKKKKVELFAGGWKKWDLIHWWRPRRSVKKKLQKRSILKILSKKLNQKPTPSRELARTTTSDKIPQEESHKAFAKCLKGAWGAQLISRTVNAKGKKGGRIDSWKDQNK